MTPVDNGVTTTGFLPFTESVAFDTLLCIVAGLAFLDDQLDTANAAVALVKHIEIVGQSVSVRYS